MIYLFRISQYKLSREGMRNGKQIYFQHTYPILAQTTSEAAEHFLVGYCPGAQPEQGRQMAFEVSVHSAACH